MSTEMRIPFATPKPERELAHETCPICGAMIEARQIAGRSGWTCLAGGYAHYYQARYGHLRCWFTSGQGNLREPVIDAMNCAA
jgi:hypothetical protein